MSDPTPPAEQEKNDDQSRSDQSGRSTADPRAKDRDGSKL